MKILLAILFIFSAKIRKVDELSLISLVKLSFFAKIKVLKVRKNARKSKYTLKYIGRDY